MGINYLSSIKTLFVLQILLFIFGVVLALRNKTNARSLPLSIKIVISLSMTTAAFVIAFYGIKATFFYSIFVFLGIMFSFIGDLTMASVIKLKNRLIGGMTFFAITHIFYIFAYVATMINGDVKIGMYVIISLVISIIVIIICKMLFVKKDIKANKVRIAAVLYGACISLMASFAFFLAFSLGGKWWITFISAMIFIISDFMIAISDILNIRIKNVGIWVWATYLAAQMGIVYAVILH
ncbi:YhhN-like protein [Clostridium tepidiprofundi DSM 19306]|uniref:YhhN-like protein n=1 Tax=Clostridium tepidiprofundi DSM 19306 TaxID=1121338 RepID=A0A151AW45_9CLOT|nr:lysoplasmalogenase family protein [Clostridium tepidiprofundi]KYH31782.1 YhhN-like protein [Clostridium tepidiprofundi DSM 19306]